MNQSPSQKSQPSRVRRSRSVRTRIHLAVAASFAGILLAAVVLALGLAASLGSRQSDSLLQSWARLGAVQMRATSFDDAHPAGTSSKDSAQVPTDSNHLFYRWSHSILAEPGVLATMIVESDGRVTAVIPTIGIPNDNTFPAVDELPVSADTMRTTWHGQAVDLACCPIDRGSTRNPVASVCIAARSDRAGSAWPTYEIAAGLAGLAGLATIPYLLLRSRVKSLLMAPMMRIVSALNRHEGRLRSDDFDPDRPDEWGDLARGICVIVDELDDTRRRATRLEASIESTDEKHTRRFNRLLAKAKHDAQLDSLTGLANRRFIEEKLDRVYRQQRDSGGHLAVVMLDLDNFKALNDTEGHAAGDRVLRLVGELLNGTLRESDVAVRYGGDEFALILADVTTQQAHAVAERICRLFTQGVKPMRLITTVSLSAGVVSSNQMDADTGMELLAAADQALYESKRNGKNRVAVASL